MTDAPVAAGPGTTPPPMSGRHQPLVTLLIVLAVVAVIGASGVPAWASIPSWYLVAAGDRAISPNLERFMASRMNAHTIDVAGAPHLVMLTNPKTVTGLIETAARATSH